MDGVLEEAMSFFVMSVHYPLLLCKTVIVASTVSVGKFI